MGLFRLAPLFFFLLFLSATFPQEESARICYLMHQQKCQEALSHYLTIIKQTEEHDFSLLQKAALALLKEGAKQEDPEVQMMCLLASSICKEPSLHFVHQRALASQNLQLQLASLAILGGMDDTASEELLHSALGSPYLITRLEALFQLAKRGHTEIFDKIQSLYVKAPDLARPLFAQIVSLIDTRPADRFLKQQLLDPDIDVRIAALKEVSDKELDQFLPQIQRLAEQSHFSQQEAALITLSHLKDQSAKTIFEKAKTSKQQEVVLAALVGLVRLGQKEALLPLHERAQKGELFAIASLGIVKDKSAANLLYTLATHHPQLDVRFNAMHALLLIGDERVFTLLELFLFDSAQDLGFYPIISPGRAFQAYRIIPSAKQNEKHYPGLVQMTQGYQQKLLYHLLELNEEKFIPIAKRIVSDAHKPLIPITMQFLENIHNEDLLSFLEQQSVLSSSPFVRGYSTLALYRLDPTGVHSKKLLDWVRSQKDFTLINVKESKEVKEFAKHLLSYEETSQLFLEALEAIAMQKSFESIELLLHLMTYGHEKNRYALAGLLIKTAA